jgi:hypothetical protein
LPKYHILNSGCDLLRRFTGRLLEMETGVEKDDSSESSRPKPNPKLVIKLWMDEPSELRFAYTVAASLMCSFTHTRMGVRARAAT